MKYFRQCRLEKRGRQDQVAFLPEKFAIKGKFLKIKGDGGWKVASVGDRKTNMQILRQEIAARRHREQTDV